MGWTVADLPLPPPKSTPKHGDVWLNPDTMEAHLYDDTLGRWFKMTQEQYLQYRGKLPPAPMAVSGVVSVPPKAWSAPGLNHLVDYEDHVQYIDEPEEKPITDFGLEDELFQI